MSLPANRNMLSGTSIFHPQSQEGWRLYGLDNAFIIASSFILLLVIGLLIYVSLKFRARPGDKEPEQIHNNRLVETFMIGIPFLMVSYFFYLTIKTMKDTEPTVTNESPTVIINGRQWWWQVSYPGTKVTTANEVHLPAQTKVLLQLESTDVIHDWWIPSFGPKMDMIPGTTNFLWLKIDEPGVYQGTCSEFCGKQHAWMRIRVVAQTPEDYKKWLEEKSKDAMSSTNASVLAGAAIFNKESCAGCHQVRGTLARGATGPDLTHLASRSTLLSGVLRNTRTNLEKFLTNPEKVKPGVHMPRYIFKKDTINALVDYLASLK